MFWLILSRALTAIFGIAIKAYNSEASEKDPRKVSIGFAFVPLILIAFSLFSVVSSGEIGIKTVFGKISNNSVPEGINIKLPWEKVEKISIKVQKYENRTPLEASTKDLQVINGVQVVVNYQVLAEQAPDLFRKVGRDYNTIVLEPAIQESVKAEFSHYNAEELANRRSEVALAIEENLNEKLSEYGIKISSVGIQNFDYSAEYNKAIESKAVAVQEALAAKERLEKTKAEAEQKIVAAEAEAKANELLNSTLTKEVIEEKFLDKWDGVLPTVYGGGNIMDVSQLIK